MFFPSAVPGGIKNWKETISRSEKVEAGNRMKKLGQVW